jgi:hypothetical protein
MRISICSFGIAAVYQFECHNYQMQQFKMMAIIVASALFIASGIAFIEEHAFLTSSAPADVPVDQLPTSHNVSSGFTPSESGGADIEESPNTVAPANLSSNTQKTAALKTAARSLQADFASNDAYPATITQIAADIPTMDSSFKYHTKNGTYSLCATLMNSDLDCITSSTDGATFVLHKSDINTISPDWRRVPLASNASDTLEVMLSPGWNQSAGMAPGSYDLPVTDEFGKEIILARINTTDFPPNTQGESLDTFGHEYISTLDANTHITQTIPSNGAISQSGGQVPFLFTGMYKDSSRMYEFSTIIVRSSLGFQTLSLFVDASMSDQLDQVLEYIASSARS